jgi:hypothetical protein
MNLLAMMLIILTATATVPYPGSVHQTNAQLTIIPQPSPIPAMGHAGATYTDPIYGNTVVQCTDPSTDPTNLKHLSFEIGDNGAASDHVWNANHSMLRVMAADTGGSRVMFVDPISHICTLIPGTAVPGGSVWDTVDPDTDYSLSAVPNAAIKPLILSERHFSGMDAPITTTLFDFRNCPGLSALGPVSWHSQLSPVPGGLVTGFSDRGGQDTGEYVVIYYLATGQCEVWNTLTGTLSGPISGKVSSFNAFTLHDVSGYPGGLVQASVGNTCIKCPAPHGPWLWKSTTNTTRIISTPPVGGHNTIGYQTYLNLSSSPKIASRTFGNQATVKYITSNAGVAFPGPQETHMGWQNVDPKDSNPVVASQVSMKQPQPLQITSPLEDEIWGVVPATGEFIRFASCMTSGIANKFNFRSVNCIAGVSPDGAAIAFSSDWGGTLGNTDGKTQACTLGAPKPNECQSQVFLVFPK